MCVHWPWALPATCAVRSRHFHTHPLAPHTSIHNHLAKHKHALIRTPPAIQGIRPAFPLLDLTLDEIEARIRAKSAGTDPPSIASAFDVAPLEDAYLDRIVRESRGSAPDGPIRDPSRHLQVSPAPLVDRFSMQSSHCVFDFTSSLPHTNKHMRAQVRPVPLFKSDSELDPKFRMLQGLERTQPEPQAAPPHDSSPPTQAAAHVPPPERRESEDGGTGGPGSAGKGAAAAAAARTAPPPSSTAILFPMPVKKKQRTSIVVGLEGTSVPTHAIVPLRCSVHRTLTNRLR